MPKVISLSLALLCLFVCCEWQSALGQQELGEGETETGATLAIDLPDLDDEPLISVMLSLLFDPNAFIIIGNEELGISGAIRAYNLEDAIQQLQELAPLLVVQRLDKFIVYSEGAEEQLGNREITYLYKARKAKAADLVNLLQNTEPEGFPIAGEVDFAAIHIGGESTATSEKQITDPLGNVEYVVAHHLNGLLLRGTFSEVQRAVEFLKIIDRPVPIVLIELLIVQYFHDDGFTWRYNLTDGQIAKADPPIISDVAIPPVIADNFYGPTDWGMSLQNVGLDAAVGGGPLALTGIGTLTYQFRQNLTLLTSEDLARVVTNPRIAVVNGQTGTIKLDEEFNFTTSVVTPTGTVSQESQQLTATTLMTVTPTVVSPDQIHLAVNAKLEVFTAIAEGFSSDLPGKRANDLGTSVLLGENETLIIGGLVKEEVNEERNRMPWFSKVPLLGHFFRSNSADQRFTETVIYLTPRLSQPQGYENAYLKQVFDQMHRLRTRGEEIRGEHRESFNTSRELYKLNELLDDKAYKASKKAIKEMQRANSHWHAQDYYIEPDSSSSSENPQPPAEPLPLPPLDSAQSVPARWPVSVVSWTSPDETTPHTVLRLPPTDDPKEVRSLPSDASKDPTLHRQPDSAEAFDPWLPKLDDN